MIDSFEAQYEFLSNFYMGHVEFEGILYPSVEHAFQAAKSLDEHERLVILEQSTPGMAKRVGRKVVLRNDWEDVKVKIMEKIVRVKFSKSPEKEMLMETGNEKLVEGNWWNDTFWGVCNGIGQNQLGKILMKVRSEI